MKREVKLRYFLVMLRFPVPLTFCLIGLLVGNSMTVWGDTPNLGTSSPSLKSDHDDGLSEHGITARFLATDAKPGEIVELRVEMIRKTWGKFELQIPSHPKLHLIAVQKVPIEYSGDLYRQRESILFQPISSGVLQLNEMQVALSLPTGVENIDLPPLELTVSPYAEHELSDTPELLPTTLGATSGGSKVAIIVIVLAVSLTLLAIGIARRFRNKETQPASEPESRMTDIRRTIAELQNGRIQRDELEKILLNAGPSMSASLRDSLEQAIYSNHGQAERIADLMQKELSA